MEGLLFKWTNVVHGWQYRYFVLDEDVLRYYTSKNKMLKGQIRGCIRLHSAVVSIDCVNDPYFTITGDGKVFRLQGRDFDEKNVWVRELERVIHEKCDHYKPQPLVEFDRKISQQSQTFVVQMSPNECFEYDKLNPSPRSVSALDSMRSLSYGLSDDQLRPLCTSTPKVPGDCEHSPVLTIRNLWRRIVNPSVKKRRKSARVSAGAFLLTHCPETPINRPT